jgi:dGTPase
VAKPLDDYPWADAREVQRAQIDDPPRTRGDERSAFERDRARIVHSVAFRRLQGKTQVFAPATADYMRSRVTHSIEVAQIGRAMAQTLGVPDSLVEAACLGHDLGHPPFGHTGEAALNACMQASGGFEGNAQSFRIVTRLEQKHPDYMGLDLTRATLLGLLKYPYRREANREKYLYDSDAEGYEEWLFDGTERALIREDNGESPPRTLQCQVMDWADDIAYSVHDLEDGIVSGYLRPATWNSDHFVTRVAENVAHAPVHWANGAPSETDIAEYIKSLYDSFARWEPDIPKDVLRETARSYIDKFATAIDVETVGDGTTLFDYTLKVPEEIRIENQVLKSITFEYILRDERTAAIFHKGKVIMDRLFEALFTSTQEERPRDRNLLFPYEMREGLAADRDNESAQRRTVCDYLASLTEGQALALYSRLFEPMSFSPHAAI